jgi:hypothetical protein
MTRLSFVMSRAAVSNCLASHKRSNIIVIYVVLPTLSTFISDRLVRISPVYGSQHSVKSTIKW